MRRKRQKREIDELLLDDIFRTQHEWKQLSSIMNQSIEPTEEGKFREAVAQAKYLFLLREARRRNLSAIQLHV
ncbi:MAG TPA: YaaL family protein [Bacillota bacterium]